MHVTVLLFARLRDIAGVGELRREVPGGATVSTGYQVKDGARVPDTGVSVVTKPGDVFFHPSNFYHGFSQVSPDIFWLNIRWDDNYTVN